MAEQKVKLQALIQLGWRRPFVKLKGEGEYIPAIVTYVKRPYAQRQAGKLTINLYRHTVFIDLWLFSLTINRYERP